MDKHVSDVQDVRAKLKKAQEKAYKSTTASTAKATKMGMTDTPTVPIELSERIQKFTDEVDQFKGHNKDHIEALKKSQEVRGETGNTITRICLIKPPFSDGTRLSTKKLVSIHGLYSMTLLTLQPVRKRLGLLKTV